MSFADAAPPLGIYIHWPFCARICPYCDFNVYKARDIDEPVWRAAFEAELNFAHETRSAGPVHSIFFGGGTPSLMSASLVSDLLATINRLWGIAADAEISIEANPEHVTREHLQDLRGAGVNRLSLGVQALTDEGLALLGRQHTPANARAAIECAQAIFTSFNVDMIYGRPQQSGVGWLAELSDLLALGPPHLSLYELTIEPDTAFGRRQGRGELAPLSDDQRADMYQLTQALCADHGLPAYEVSNYARPGHACWHNVATWQGGDYIGIGPGAHGRITPADPSQAVRLATLGALAPKAWLDAVAADGHGWSQIDPLDARAVAEEQILLGLRLCEGIAYAPPASHSISEPLFSSVSSVSVTPTATGAPAFRSSLAASASRDSLITPERLDPLIEQGYFEMGDGRLRATPKGRLVLDHLVGMILA